MQCFVQLETAQGELSAVAEELAAIPNVLEAFATTGGSDVLCRVAAASHQGLQETLLRIATSGWMQRIWTLQEGLLARELYFEVADGLVDCSHFDGEASAVAARLIPTLQYRLQNGALRFQRRLAERPRCSLYDLIGLMRLRSTSCPEDEPLAIAGLLGIDAEKLASM